MRITAQHLLEGESCSHDLCQNKDSGIFGAGQLDTIVIHFTAGSSVSSAVNTLKDPTVQASAHVVVGRAGEIVQHPPFDKIAWHAGRSSHLGRSGLNRYSIGIEIDNAGRLSKSGSSYKSWFGREYSPEESIEAIHRNEDKVSNWHAYAELQLVAVFDLCRLLAQQYQLKFIVGHEEISPQRKTDPGPAFPLEKLREAIVDTAERRQDQGLEEALVAEPDKASVEWGRVKASSLNIRALPQKNAQTILPPLPHDERLEILQEKDGWLYVDVSRKGWVKKEYIEVG